jgi:hypothetical protein
VTRQDVARFLSALKGPDRLSTLRAVGDGGFVFLMLYRRGLRPLLRERPELPLAEPAGARRTAEAVDAALGLLPVAPTCLRRSVTLLRELNRRGTNATLHIGVRSTAGHVEAHAWVQTGDQIINDSPAVVDTYARIAAGDAERLLPTFS